MPLNRLAGPAGSARASLSSSLVPGLVPVLVWLALAFLATGEPAHARPLTAGAPRYQTYAASLGLGTSAGEPSIGVDWRTGNVLFQSYLQTLRVSFDDCSSPAQATWVDRSAPTSVESLDPILYCDSALGRTFVSQLTGEMSLSSHTDDDGDHWTPNQGGPFNSGVDHQTIGGGPFAPAVITATTAYTHAVYYCSQDVADAMCALSSDGGQTYGPGIPIYTINTCGGLHGHVKVSPVDGTVYVPNRRCFGYTPPTSYTNQGIAVSKNNGLTWNVYSIVDKNDPTNPSKIVKAGGVDPSVGIGAGGRVYMGMQNVISESGQIDSPPYVAVSDDAGQTWHDVQRVGVELGISNSVFPAVVAGDNDRAAFAFLGTPTAGNYQNATNWGAGTGFQGIWHLYIASTFDGGITWTTVDATPNDPVQRGSICTSGTTCPGGDRNLLDFNDVTVDAQGRVLVAYADGCTGPCVKGPPNSYSALATIARQSGGKRLYAAYDPIEPALPGAPLLTGSTSTTGQVHLAWAVPDNGGAPLTGYNVYRSSNPDSGYQLIASVLATQTTYDDNNPPAGPHFYKVSALNVLGEGPTCRYYNSATATGESTCTPPGITVLTDPAGDELDQDPSHDIQKVSLAEPYYPDGVSRVVWTLKVASLQTLTPQTFWRVYFSVPNPTTPITPYLAYVDMRTDPANNVSFKVSPDNGTTLYDADLGSNYKTDGTITIIAPTSRIDNPTIGTTLFAIYSRVIVGAIVPDNANYPSPSASIGYTLVGNGICRPVNGITSKLWLPEILVGAAP